MLAPDLAKNHVDLWFMFKGALKQHRIPQALLLLGEKHNCPYALAYCMTQAILCHDFDNCKNNCQSCYLMQINEHPDYFVIEPEKSNAAIKIEKIRTLQTNAFTTPVIGQKKLILIKHAHKLNQSASNALLKLLEEPPAHLYFLLVAENKTWLPQTILSRCQLWQIHAQKVNNNAQVITEELTPLTLVEALEALQAQKITQQDLVVRLKKIELAELLSLFYRATAAMIRFHFAYHTSHQNGLPVIANRYDPEFLFTQMDKINAIIIYIKQSIVLNQTLVLEEVLFDYLKGG